MDSLDLNININSEKNKDICFRWVHGDLEYSTGLPIISEGRMYTNKKRILPNTTYKIIRSDNIDSSIIAPRYYDKDKKFLGSGKQFLGQSTVTTFENAYYIALIIEASEKNFILKLRL